MIQRSAILTRCALVAPVKCRTLRQEGTATHNPVHGNAVLTSQLPATRKLIDGLVQSRLKASSSPSITLQKKGKSRVSTVSLIWW